MECRDEIRTLEEVERAKEKGTKMVGREYKTEKEMKN